ncbi:MAG: hypothetical protein HKO79_00205 [Desulfobacterales bacterium]|nr:hypothetical protein [Deltaproteobacteria bacterium]NNL40894.1 hypothetical protein [Desulfobacterales bacterium]
MKPIVNRPKMYQCLVISLFFGTGAVSVYLFFQIPSLPFLQGINEEALMTVVSLAWLMIIPAWMVLFFAAITLFEAFLRRLDS